MHYFLPWSTAQKIKVPHFFVGLVFFGTKFKMCSCEKERKFVKVTQRAELRVPDPCMFCLVHNSLTGL